MNQVYHHQIMSYPQYQSERNMLPGVQSLLAEISQYHETPYHAPSALPSVSHLNKRTRDAYENHSYQSYEYEPTYEPRSYSRNPAPELPLKKRRANDSLAVSIPTPFIQVSAPTCPQRLSPSYRDEEAQSRSPLSVYSEPERSPSTSPTPRSPYSRNGVITPETVKQAITEKLFPSPNSTRGKSAKSKSHHFLPHDAVKILKEWFYFNVEHPYPSSAEKERLSKETGLSYLQVSNWFTNSRKRVWAPTVRLAGATANLEAL
jgi:hypothetical protein